jgi:peptide/nickel transport system permease protein
MLGRFARHGVAASIPALLCVLYFLLMVLVLAAPGLLAPSDPTHIDVTHILAAPSHAHLLGTDEAGRDLLSRVIYGARESVLASLAIILIAAVVGTTIGTIAGFVGGFLDFAAMRVVDAFMSFPYFILALALAGVLGRGAETAVIALAAVWWPSYARLTRGLVISIRQNLFVEAAEAVGTRPGRLLLTHILPHMRRELAVRVSIDTGHALIALAGLSFLGLGPSPPTPEWGLMITASRDYLTQAWWYPVFPGLAISITAFFFALVGDLAQGEPDGRPTALRRWMAAR